MKYSWQSEQTEQKKCDRVLILVLAIIIVTGLVILYSTSAYNGEIKFQDTFYYLKKQVFVFPLLKSRKYKNKPLKT